MVLFEKKVLSYIENQQLIEAGDRLLIACSGGIDSMGLLHFFLYNKEKLNVSISVAHVDHMLRGDVSAKDRIFVEQFCGQHDIPIFSKAIPIPKIIEEERGNSQTICRRERYDYFSHLMKEHNLNKLITAHHADDQLESLLMSLTRSGSVKGIFPKRSFFTGEIIRPFLTVTKMEIGEYLEGKGGTYREDSSNSKDDYTRNRFRHHIVPLLKEENRHVANHAVNFVEKLQQDEHYLNQLANERFSFVVTEKEENCYSFQIPKLQNEPLALQRRIILILLNYLYKNSNYNQSSTVCSSILGLCKSEKGSATIHLPEQVVAVRNYSEIVVSKNHFHKISAPIHQVKPNEWIELQHGIQLYIGDEPHVDIEQLPNVDLYYFNSSQFTLPLFVRTRKEGDRIIIKGMDQHKRVSRVFIDDKIPLNQRDEWPILVDSNDEVVSILGVRVHRNLSKSKRLNDNMKLIIRRI